MSAVNPSEPSPSAGKPDSGPASALKAFFSSLPGILTAVGGLIAAIATFISATDKVGFFVRATPTPAVTFTATATATAMPTLVLSPTPTFTAQPTPTPLATATPKPAPTAGTLLLDDFRDASRWDSESSQDVECGVQGGEYRFLVHTPDQVYWVNPVKTYDFSDCAIDVDVRRVAGPQDNEYAILARYQPDDSFYAFSASSDGTFAVLLYQGDKWHEIVPWTPAQVVRGGEATNHLRVELRGPQLRLYVNGVLLAFVEDPTLRSGTLGLLAGTGVESEVEVRFANLRVTALGASTDAPTVATPSGASCAGALWGNGAMKTTVLFDLGGTLAGYYTRAEFPPILERAIGEVRSYLAEEGLLCDDAASRRERVCAEDYEDADHRVRPLGERLLRIFQLDLAPTSPRVADLCARFMQPIFALACLYKDTLEVLDDLTARGVRMAVVTNTPWGSPAALWHGEIERLGLARHIETVVSCAEVGWRKPAPPIFQRALAKLDVSAKECLFVGDDPRWDIAGPRAVGIDALLIERGEPLRHPEERPIRTLHELWCRLEEYPLASGVPRTQLLHPYRFP